MRDVGVLIKAAWGHGGTGRRTGPSSERRKVGNGLARPSRRGPVLGAAHSGRLARRTLSFGGSATIIETPGFGLLFDSCLESYRHEVVTESSASLVLAPRQRSGGSSLSSLLRSWVLGALLDVLP